MQTDYGNNQQQPLTKLCIEECVDDTKARMSYAVLQKYVQCGLNGQAILSLNEWMQNNLCQDNEGYVRDI